MKGGKYTKAVAKIQVKGIFHIRDIRRNLLPKFYRNLYGDAMLVPTWIGTNLADGNQQKHPLPRFATKAWIYIPQGTHKH